MPIIINSQSGTHKICWIILQIWPHLSAVVIPYLLRCWIVSLSINYPYICGSSFLPPAVIIFSMNVNDISVLWHINCILLVTMVNIASSFRYILDFHDDGMQEGLKILNIPKSSSQNFNFNLGTDTSMNKKSWKKNTRFPQWGLPSLEFRGSSSKSLWIRTRQHPIRTSPIKISGCRWAIESVTITRRTEYSLLWHSSVVGNL